MPIQVPVTQTGLEASIQAAAQRAGRNLKIDLGVSSRSIGALSQPLGKITGQADQFTKSMEAANARVLAFGASVGVLSAVSQGFKEIIGTTIQVEKSLADINSVLGANAKELNKFKNDIFKIAKETGNSFKTVADAALEISRQGGDPSLVLTKLKDSMILARLSGLDAASAVEGLSAAVNSFSKQGVTTSEVLNKISKTAAKFAVSERDLIEGFKRSASVAQQAGVSIDELGGIITAVQQKTARGGAVIGNAFKTIFSRIRNPESLQALQDLKIQVTDIATGKLLPATKLIENLAQKMDKLNDVQLGEISLTVGGGFQIGPLLAALDDMSSKTSVYSEATKDMQTASTEAYQRNIALNKTLAAAINVSVVSLQELANTLGEIGITDNLKNLLGFFNSFINEVQNTLNGEGLGSDLAKGLVKGIANVLSGPGLAIFGVIVAKLTINFAQFGIQALKTFLNMGSAAKEIGAIQSSIASTLLNNKSIQTQILALEGDRVAQAKFFSTALNTQLATMEKMRGIAVSIAPAVYGATTGGRGKARAAGGYMPTVMAEANDISKGVGGARPSDRPVVIPNFAFGGGKTGTMVAHTGEHVVPNYNGGSGSAIFNRDMVGRMGLPSGAQKIRGAGGFIPNFEKKPETEDEWVKYWSMGSNKVRAKNIAAYTEPTTRISQNSINAARKVSGIINEKKEIKEAGTLKLNASRLGFVSVSGATGVSADAQASGFKGDERASLDEYFGKEYEAVILQGIQTRSLATLDKSLNDNQKSFRQKVASRLITPTLQLAQDIMPNVFSGNDAIDQKSALIKNTGNGDPYLFSDALLGGVFESAVGLATGSVSKMKSFNETEKNRPFDFEEAGGASVAFKKAFGFDEGKNIFKAEAKKTQTSDTLNSVVGKALRDASVMKVLKSDTTAVGAQGKASGYIPNFANQEYILSTLQRIKAGTSGFSKQEQETFLKKFGATGGTGKGISLKQVFDDLDSDPSVSPFINKAYGAAGATASTSQVFKEFERQIKANPTPLRNVVKGKGFIPNFADPLNEAISREIGAGVNPSQVYIDQNNSLKGPMNPSGLMVANRRDEPSGGWQGINRARKEGANAKTYGAAGGFVPNYANTENKTDTNMLAKLLALQVGISVLTGFIDQAGTSGQKFSEGLNKAMTTLLIFGTLIYSGPMKSLKAFADRLNKTSTTLNSAPQNRQIGALGGFQKGFGLGLNKRSAGLQNIVTPNGSLQASPVMSMMSRGGQTAARIAAPIGSAVGTAGAALGAIALPAAAAAGAFKAINDFAGAFAMPSKEAAKNLGAMSIVASEAASSLSALETNAASVAAKTAKGANDVVSMLQNTFATGLAGSISGQSIEKSAYRGTKGKADLQLAGISADDFSKMQEDFTKVYLAANKEGSLAARQYNAKAEFEKTLGIDTSNTSTQVVGEAEVIFIEGKLKSLAKEARAKKGILSIDEQIQRVEELILKDGQRQIDLGNQRAITVLKTKNLLDGSLSSMDKAVLSNQILNNLTEKQSDELNARVALRDREVQFGESQLNNLNQQIQAYDGVTTSLEAVQNYQRLSSQYSEDGLLTQEELIDLAKKALLVQKSYTDDGQKLNQFGAAQLLIKEDQIKQDIKQKKLIDQQAAAREKETAALKEQLNTRESILAVARRTVQAQSFGSNFSAQQNINANNLAIAKLGLQQPTSQAGARALNLQKANLEAANVPFEADKTRTDATKQAADELINLSSKVKYSTTYFADLASQTKNYSQIQSAIIATEKIYNANKKDGLLDSNEEQQALLETTQKLQQLTQATDQEIKTKENLSGVNVELAKLEPKIQDLVGKLSDFAESLAAAAVELQFKKLSETTGQGMLDLTSEQKLNAALQSAGTDKTQISEAYSQAAMTKDQQRLSLATSGKDISAITYDLEINKEILAIKKEAVDQDQLTEEQIERIIALEQKRVNKGPLQKFKEAFSETDTDRANRFTDTLVSGAVKFRDTMIDGMVNAVEQGGSLGDILQSAALDFAREMTKTNLTNMFSMGQSAVGSLFQGYASGGKITGGSGNKDDVPAMLMGGEYVMNKRAVSKYGTGFMEALNNGSVSGFADGGSVIRSRGLATDVINSSNVGDQTGEGGFQMPGYYGSGAITGKKDLLSYASQAYTSGAGDIIGGGDNSAYIDITPESVRLTNFGRSQGPMAAAVRESKEQSLDLYFQQLAAEKQAKEEEKAQKKAFKRAIITALITSAVGAVVGAGAAGFKAGVAGAGPDAGFMGSLGAGAKGVFTGGDIGGGVMAGGLKNLFSGNYQLSQISDLKGYSQYLNKNPEEISKFLAGSASKSITGAGGGTLNAWSGDAMGPDGMPTFNLPIVGEPDYNDMVLPPMVTGFATGGRIPQTSGIDTVPAMLSGGEFIMNAGATQRIGASNLNAMNSGASTETGSSAINDQLISKLDELIKITKESSKPVTVNVSSQQGQTGGDNQGEENKSEKDQNLSRKIKAAVIAVLQEEKRLGGVLRRS